MALKNNQFIKLTGEYSDVYTRIEEETSLKKSVYNARLRKYIMKDGKRLDVSFDEFLVSNIPVNLNLPIREQLYNFINQDNEYENV